MTRHHHAHLGFPACRHCPKQEARRTRMERFKDWLFRFGNRVAAAVGRK